MLTTLHFSLSGENDEAKKNPLKLGKLLVVDVKIFFIDQISGSKPLRRHPLDWARGLSVSLGCEIRHAEASPQRQRRVASRCQRRSLLHTNSQDGNLSHTW